MVSSISSQAIAPATLLRGQGAWGEALTRLPQLCQHPFLLGRSISTQPLRDQLSSDLESLGLSVTAGIFSLIAARLISSVLLVKFKLATPSWLPGVEKFLMQANFLPID
jgi:hypothetical protein